MIELVRKVHTNRLQYINECHVTGARLKSQYNPPVCGISDCCSILGAILCARIPLSYSIMDVLLALPQHRPSRKSISRLRCVFRISDMEGIRILHPSFYDYLSERCSAELWSINLELHNTELTLRCIKLLDNSL